MTSETIKEILGQYTKFKPKQIEELQDLILQYDSPQELLYEIIGLSDSGMSFAKIKKDFKEEKFGWEGLAFEQQQWTREAKDKQLTNPPEVREGEMECPKCKKKKTIVIEVQTRSADEGFTYYIHCFNPDCKKITKT